MSAQEQSVNGKDGSRTIIYIIIAGVAVLLVGGLFYLKSRPETAAAQQRLEGALRAGSPDFEKYRDLTRLDEPEATEAVRPIGDVVMTLTTTARNFTGRTINGLEVHAVVVDSQKNPVKERTLIVVPTRQPEIEPNKTMKISVLLDGMKKDDDRANIKMEVVGIRFK
jgi:hypothetical protein